MIDTTNTAKEDQHKAVLAVTKAPKGVLCSVHYQEDGAWSLKLTIDRFPPSIIFQYNAWE